MTTFTKPHHQTPLVFMQLSNPNLIVRCLGWLSLCGMVASIVAVAVVVFLYLLDAVTVLRFAHPWLLFLLPLAGIGLYFLYEKWGKNTSLGMQLIYNKIQNPNHEVPHRLAGFILLSTLITHLFGGSAGREGTALQMGGGLANSLGRSLGLAENQHRILLRMGISAGFGAVFGTPLTGTIFAIEILVVNKIDYKAIVPCLVSAFLAHWACMALGVVHTPYHVTPPTNLPYFFSFSGLLFCKIVVASICFGLVANLFSGLQESIKTQSKKHIKIAYLIPFVGGLLLIVLTYFLDTKSYLGLGVNSPNLQDASIVSSFRPEGVRPFSWFWKLFFTAITLGTGFRGGEVTPLFFIGASLGNILGAFSHSPPDLMAALGFVAVFAGTNKTPLAGSIMGIELFGFPFLIYYLSTCFIASWVVKSKNGLIAKKQESKALRAKRNIKS